MFYDNSVMHNSFLYIVAVLAALQGSQPSMELPHIFIHRKKTVANDSSKGFIMGHNGSYINIYDS